MQPLPLPLPHLSLQLMVNPEENEFFSEMRWADLYQLAIEKHAPFLMVVVLEVSHSGHISYQICEGTLFHRREDQNRISKDPGTILRTYSFAIPCFEIKDGNYLNCFNKCLPLEELKEGLKEKEFDNMLEGANPFYENKDESLMANIKLITAGVLGKAGRKEEELIWLKCAAGNKHPNAEVFYQLKLSQR